MENALLKKALFLVSKKISVIPVGKNKIPLIPWKEFQERYATPEEIRAWFEKYPDAQLGIVTGKISNLTVVDVENGGDPSFLPQNTTIIKTGGNGFHYYYKFCPGMQNKARIKELIDIRGEGGYVMAPGSESEKGKYEIIKSLPAIAFPVNLFSEKKKQTYVGGADSVKSFEIDDYPGYGEGQRNDQMTRYVGYVLSKVHPSKWDSVAWGVVVSANQKNNPPLSDHELLNTFNSIKNREVSSFPDRWSKKTVEEIKKEGEALKDDSLDLMKNVADLQIKELNTSTPISTGYKKVDEALKGGVRLGDLIVMSGETGQGKTLAASNIAVNMAEHGEPVLFLTYEVFVSEVWEKMKEMGVKDDIQIFTPRCHTSGRLAWVQKKIKEAKEYNVKFIVIDHLEFLTADDKYAKNVNLNFANKISEVVKEVKNIARNEGVCILLLCHLRKVNQGRPGINDLKDTVSIGQEADCVMLVERVRLDNPQNNDDIYSPVSIWSIQKNRRSGKSCYVEVVMMNGRMIETEKVVLNQKNNEAKEATGEDVLENIPVNPIQSLLDIGFGGPGI